jgi:hypothetical protein
MSNSKVKWPNVGRKGLNHDEHTINLKTEAQQLNAALRAPSPGKKQAKRALPHDQAAKFLESFLEWIEREEDRTHGDPVLEAIQRLEQLIVTRPDASNSSIGSGRENGHGPRSWAQVAGAGGAGRMIRGENSRQPTGTPNTNTTVGTILNRDQCEIRIRMNDPAISEELRRKPDTADTILRTVNH